MNSERDAFGEKFINIGNGQYLPCGLFLLWDSYASFARKAFKFTSNQLTIEIPTYKPLIADGIKVLLVQVKSATATETELWKRAALNRRNSQSIQSNYLT